MSNKQPEPEFHVVPAPEITWSWSPLFGIMYGQIPVGLIFGIPLLLIIAMSQ